MKVTNARKPPADATLILGMYPGRQPAAGCASYLRKMGKWVEPALEAMDFDGEHGKVAVLPWPDGDVSRVVIVGLGEDLDVERLRQASGCARKSVAKADHLATTLHQLPIDGATSAVIDGIGMSEYRYERYKGDAENRVEVTLTLVGAGRGWEKESESSAIVTEHVALARDLVNTPAADLSPLAFATIVGEKAEAAGLEATVLAGDQLVAERLNGLRGVGQGSHRPPCMLHLAYRPRRAKAKLALVGKGIIFDSGGLSIKPADSMEGMKDDMAGAAAISAAAIAIARLGIPIEIDAYAALAENLPGGGAQRPGDVIRYRNGKTIEVLNTDAEGRLVLADGLCLAAEDNPDLIVDLATLTGAITIALGDKIAGVFGNDETWVERVVAAADGAGERVWAMPMPADYRPYIDSSIADMKNTGKQRLAGAITAALLLQEFVGDTPWVHIDIAGPAFVTESEHYIPKGGTGFGVRTLIELARAMTS